MGDEGVVTNFVVADQQLVVDGIGRHFVIAGDQTSPQGVTRDQLTVPVCRGSALSDEVLYESPDAANVYYLPRWQIVQSGGLPQIVMQQSASGWSLVVHLASYAAPSIANDLGSATTLTSDLSCLVRYNLAAEAGATMGVIRDVVATEVTGDGSAIVATFSGTEPAALNQLYSAMTEDSHGTVLTVRRTVTAAVQLPDQTQPTNTGILGGIVFRPLIIRNPPDPVIVDPIPVVINQPDPVDTAGPVASSVFTPGNLGLAVTSASVLRLQPKAQPAAAAHAAPQATKAAAPAPHLDVSGKVLHRFEDNGGGFGVGLNVGLSDVVIHHGNWIISDPVPDTSPRFDVNTVELNDVQPFFYPRDLYPAIYAGVTAGSASFSMNRVEITFDGKPYPYYRDTASAANFYYLPDSFELGRSLTTPHVLMLQVDTTDTTGTMSDVKVRFNYAAVPVTSVSRLAAAREALRAFAPGPYPPGVTGPQLMPLVVAREALQLSMLFGDETPTGDGNGALLSLRNGITNSATLSVPQFSTVYNALFGGIALLSGSLDVRLGGASGPSESIPVQLRAGDAWGPVVDIVGRSAGADADAVDVTITNTIESPVTVRSLSASVGRGAAAPAADGTVDLGAATLPVDLPPGAQLTMKITASQPLAGVGNLTAAVDPRLEVHPDARAVWTSIFGHTAPMPLTRSVTARLPADIFTERAGPDGHPALKGVTVEFEAGVAAPFDPTDVHADNPSPFITKLVSVPVGLEGYVVAGVAPGTYNYRVTAITATNDLVRESAPRTSNLDVLDITLPGFPPPT